jgi:hypothetical protein
MRATFPAHFILLHLITLITFGVATNCEASHYAVFSRPTHPNFLHSSCKVKVVPSARPLNPTADLERGGGGHEPYPAANKVCSAQISAIADLHLNCSNTAQKKHTLNYTGKQSGSAVKYPSSESLFHPR